MWSTLAGDLNEFVSTVAGDTADALNRMDENFPETQSPAAEERLRRLELPETFEAPLISPDDDEAYKQDVQSFLTGFEVASKTEEIAALLKDEDEETLKVAFEALVPTKVTYEDFWTRYYYRCDEVRIQAEIDQEEQEEQEARKEAFKSISVVGNLLGGAVKAVSASLKEDDSANNETKPFQMTKNQASKAGMFGTASGRPPFVLNTAVSEGDDDEEEELGWDDDDEEDDDDENENDQDEDAGEGQIEFNDAVTEKLEEQLKLALEERDQLHQTVELQQKEIATLKSQGAESAEIEQLKTQLFEKESEVAALRASSMDQDSGVLANKDDTAIKALEAKVDMLTIQAEQDKATIEQERKQNEELLSQVSSLESAAKASNEEILARKSENQSLEQKYQDAETRVRALEESTRKLEDALRQKEESGSMDAGGEASVDAGVGGAASVDSPETNASSGVKVEAEDSPTLPEPAAAEASGEGDGWDDDW